MRGKATGARIAFDRLRITPAYAGKRLSHNQINSIKGDHPRLCGEKRKERHLIGKEAGSPPPMRGKGFFGSQQRPPDRITPAYAGKSSGMLTSHTGYKDHPRLCGEKHGSR